MSINNEKPFKTTQNTSLILAVSDASSVESAGLTDADVPPFLTKAANESAARDSAQEVASVPRR